MQHVWLLIFWGLISNFFNLYDRTVNAVIPLGYNNMKLIIESPFIDSLLGIVVSFLAIKIIIMIVDKAMHSEEACIGDGAVYVITALGSVVGMSNCLSLLKYIFVCGFIFNFIVCFRTYIINKQFAKLFYMIGLTLTFIFALLSQFIAIAPLYCILNLLQSLVFFFLYIKEVKKEESKPIVAPFVPPCMLAALIVLMLK